jgi:hypothetical protein
MMMSIRRLTSAWNWNFSLEDSMAARSESENDPALQNQATTYDLITFCNMPNHCAFLELISGLRTTRVADSKSRPGANGLWLHHPTSAWMDMEKGISSKQ